MTDYNLMGVWGRNLASCGMSPLRQTWKTALDQTYTTNVEGMLGCLRFTADGRAFRWVRADAAIAVGNPVCSESIQSAGGGDGVAADVDAAALINTNLLYAVGDFANLKDKYADPGWFVYLNTGTSAGQLKHIAGVKDDNNLVIEGGWDTALDGTETYITFNPFYVFPCPTTSLIVQGVAQVAIAAESYGWVQVLGIGAALCDGSEDPLVPGEMCVVGTAVAGTIKGFTAGGTTADEAAKVIGFAVADVAALDIIAPVDIKLL